jgi:hypothetical protein
MDSSHQPDPSSRALAAVGLLAAAAGALADDPGTLERLRAALRHFARRREALVLLGNLPMRYNVMLADDLAWSAISEDTLLVRQVFGRLPRHEVISVVPPAVWRQLAVSPDAEAYRRLAELLAYLGLDEALRELCAAALASDDSGVREVGEEFQSE